LKKILILGADGYLGWAATIYFSNLGYKIAVVDNYLKRKISSECNVNPILENYKLKTRVNIFENLSNKKVKTFIGDLKNWIFISSVIKKFKPDVVIHYAEQPSAPYSDLNYSTGKLSLTNNIITTYNVLYAVKKFTPNAHIIKLGTMGEYGTPNIDIEEGWLTIKHNKRKDIFLFPRQGGSLYHTTKILDTDLIWFYVRKFNLKVTDLMQGPVYGIFLNNEYDKKNLLTSFYYDKYFGTIINRFIVQASLGLPLSIYGSGNQKRGYIDIRDSLRCVHLAIKNSPNKGNLNIYNQFTEILSVNEISKKIINASRKIGLKVKSKHFKNNRLEKEKHYYNPENKSLLKLGLKPNYLSEETIIKLIYFALDNKKNIKTNNLYN